MKYKRGEHPNSQKNLVPQFSSENSRENQAKSVIARKHNTTLRNAYRAKLTEMMLYQGKEMTGAEILAEEHFEHAKKDPRYFESFRDTAGEKPTDKIEANITGNQSISIARIKDIKKQLDNL